MAPGSSTTTATLTYYAWPEGEQPYLWINEPPAGTAKANTTEDDHQTTIHDLRGTEDYGLDLSGFGVVKQPSALSYDDFADETKVTSTYYEEVKAILAKQTGAHRVEIFDHTIRRRPPPNVEVPDTPSSRQPVSRVHVDQTPASGVERVHRHTGADADDLLKGRVQLINLWRPLRGPVKDIPLALADFRSVDVTTLVPSKLIYSPDRIGETFAVKYSDNLRWNYLSDMQADEALLIKCFDSASLATPEGVRDGIASLTPHTAFIDDRYKDDKDVPRRESIEVRALVFSQ